MEVKLDEHQMKAVEHFEGPALVVAGPGSGKTTVIIERIRHLIRKHNVNPERIIAIAFTNPAVDEMKKRLADESNLPEICTLHVFGKDLITNHYELLGFSKAPDIWDEKKIRQIINDEKKLLDRETQTAAVTIYKIKDMMTGQCYIGQTTNPERRREEHFNHSSNSGLRDALQKGKEQFDFDIIEVVKGSIAFPREKYWIDYYRNRSVVNLVQGIEQVERKSSNVLVVIYKIQSLSDVTAYIGYTTNPESIRKIIEDDGTKRFTFEIIRTEVPWNEAAAHIANEIKNHKNWAVFNREDPESARYSNQLRIEIFCQHFNIPYNKVLEQPDQFENLMEKFDDLKEDIEKAKRQVSIGLFEPDKIGDLVLQAFAKRYEKRKDEADAIDFLDMLILSAYMLEGNQDLLREYRNTYRYVFVDEFQDISPVDFRLIKLFPENLFVVGDDDQAIYGFRGGNSEIMQNYGAREDVKEYKVTRNYRSTATIVRHAKALVEHNSQRIGKKLHAENLADSRVEVLKTSWDTVETTLLNELLPIVTVCETHFKENTPHMSNFLLCELTVPQKIGILARNWYEVKPIQFHLNTSLLDKGFQVSWSNSDDLEKRKLIMRRGQKEIEVSTIHSAKGQEWHKVILLVNTVSYSKKPSIPDQRNDLTDERKVFYVAVTRAKHELVIFDGENCEFVSEFQELPYSERKKQLVKVHRDLLSAFGKRLNDAKEQLQKVSETLPRALNSQRARPIKVTSQIAQRQHQLELTSLQDVIIEAEKARKDIELEIREKLKLAKETFLKKLIPILDQLESVVKNATEKVETKDVPLEFTTFCQNTNSSRKQFLDYLEIYEVRPIETIGKRFNPNLHNIVRSIYSDEVPDEFVIEESKPGYLLDRKIFRKALVVVSRGIKPLETKRPTDLLLTQDFTQPVIFATYKGIYYLRNIKSLSEKIIGVDRRGPVVRLKKIDVLFAFPYEDWAQVKPNLTMKTSVKNLKLQPVEPVSEKQRFDDRILRSIHVGHDTEKEEIRKHSVQLVTRAGYVLNGCLLDFDRKVLHISMGEKTVIVYRHGILEIKRNAEIESIDTKNSLKAEKESPCPVDSDHIIQTSITEKDNFGIDIEKHSQILKEQIQKLEIPSERIISPTDEASVIPILTINENLNF